MILEKETTEKFGRLPIRTLDKWVVSCDYCGVLCDKTEKNRRKANIDIAPPNNVISI